MIPCLVQGGGRLGSPTAGAWYHREFSLQGVGSLHKLLLLSQLWLQWPLVAIHEKTECHENCNLELGEEVPVLRVMASTTPCFPERERRMVRGTQLESKSVDF